MIIDFHTHVFPEPIAEKTVHNLERVGCVKGFTNGTLTDLKRSMKESGVTHSVVLPIVTKPSQFRHVNEFAQKITHLEPDANGCSIISFGGIHPDSTDYKDELRQIKDMGLKGIKLHPYYQATHINDIRYKRIIDFASQLDLIISVHCGRDLGYPDQVYATPKETYEMVQDVRPKNLVLAHLGGHDLEAASEQILLGGDFYFDLAYSLRLIPPSQVLRMARNHGIERILFATDSPWSGQKIDVDYLYSLGFSYDELDDILFRNGAQLLGISPS